MESEERLGAELSLLEAMYPESIYWDGKTREMKYHSVDRSFHLRIPHDYLSDRLPDVLAATARKADVRDELKNYVLSCTPGEEVLDSIISAFSELAEPGPAKQNSGIQSSNGPISDDSMKATVIVWLHHLLNTNKRKQALSPPSSEVNGITKPGYPGVLIYSGPAKAVHEHVSDLKQLNWQAFQIRLESEQEWTFSHGAGVKEVEAMKDMVSSIGDQKKEIFLEVMRMK